MEETLSAGGGLDLTVKGAPEAVTAAVSAVPGVTGCTVTGQSGPETRVKITGEGDPREGLFFALAEARLPILELRPRTASLEEVFLDLTDEDDTVAAKAAALLTGRHIPEPEIEPSQPEETPAETEGGSGDDGNL